MVLDKLSLKEKKRIVICISALKMTISYWEINSNTTEFLRKSYIVQSSEGDLR